MNLKPIFLMVFPQSLKLKSSQLGVIQEILRKEYPEYWVLVMVVEEAEEIYFEIASYKTMSYLSYASLLQIIDENQYDRLERWRQYVLTDQWDSDLSEYEEDPE